MIWLTLAGVNAAVAGINALMWRYSGDRTSCYAMVLSLVATVFCLTAAVIRP